MTRCSFCAAALTAAGTLCAPAMLQAAPSASSPAAVVQRLYAWYRGPHPVRGGYWGDDLSRAQPFFDPGLYALLRDSVAFQRTYGMLVLDFDPFIGAQIAATSIEPKAPVARGAFTAVPLAIAYEKGGHGAVTVIVANASGRVYDIDGRGYTLRSMLAASLKSARAYAAKRRGGTR